MTPARMIRFSAVLLLTLLAFGRSAESAGFSGASKWIGLEGRDETNWLQDAYPGFIGANTRLSWIWAPRHEGEQSAGPRRVYFRREIVLPEPKPAIKEVHLQYVGDSECRAWVNGVALGAERGAGWPAKRPGQPPAPVEAQHEPQPVPASAPASPAVPPKPRPSAGDANNLVFYGKLDLAIAAERPQRAVTGGIGNGGAVAEFGAGGLADVIFLEAEDDLAGAVGELESGLIAAGQVAELVAVLPAGRGGGTPEAVENG